MPKNVIQYDILISCPGDIENEIVVINSVIDTFNRTFSDVLGITLRTKHWSKDAYAQSGGKPQELLNGQLVNECDAAIAIFWTRFGTPTDKYGSGTEEEIETMISSGKQVFMYFSDRAMEPSKMRSEEYVKVKAFKDKYKDKGIYFTYTTDDQLKTDLFAHISQHFLSLKRISEMKEDRNPILVLKGIDENYKIKEYAVIQKFIPNVIFNIEKYLDEIKVLYSNISALKLKEKIIVNEKVSLSFSQPIKIDENTRVTISEMAKHLKIELNKDFFNLGNLFKNSLASIYGTGIEGTKEEKKKYQMIKSLEKYINDFMDWIDFEKGFSKYDCIKLALMNDGTSIDKDIEIALKINKDMLIITEDFPRLDDRTSRHLLKECNMYEIFGIESTSEYMNYYSTNKNIKPNIKKMTNIGLPGYSRDYEEDLQDKIQDIFNYSLYLEQDQYIVKLKIDYLKHHTAVAFPTIIFLKQNPGIISYSISSTNMSQVIEGNIEIINILSEA